MGDTGGVNYQMPMDVALRPVTRRRHARCGALQSLFPHSVRRLLSLGFFSFLFSIFFFFNFFGSFLIGLCFAVAIRD
jgi:hypothetical protein